jgi:DNA-binding winged helix-turn-helix (wHTH) protein
MHGIGVYAAKAYQMLGDREHSLSILSDELKRMRSTGAYEEIWMGYLFAAEIHYQNTFIDRENGANTSYETTRKYFALADEYAPLFRKTDFQVHWAKMLALTYSLIFTNSPRNNIITEIRAGFELSGDYLKSIILARLYGYFSAVSDYKNAAECAQKCIEVGERAGIYLHSALAYGVLARISIAADDMEKAKYHTEQYLRFCHEKGIYEYFRARKDYDSILRFADENGIEPEITKRLMEFSGYVAKKAYIKTFGGFTVLSYRDRKSALKMRTKKERELLAFLLDAGEQGVTKEQICDALWPDSESENIKRLIGTNLYQINKDLKTLGIENAIICNQKRYSIRTDEIECDFKLFENVSERLHSSDNIGDKQTLLTIYTGEYLSDFEALWAIPKRIEYNTTYEEIVKALPLK